MSGKTNLCARTHARQRIVFLQLPLPDNDPAGVGENHRLAALYLRSAMERAGEERYYESVEVGVETDRLDNRHVADMIVAARPSVLAATLYVWNVERTMGVLGLVRRRVPAVNILVGGPEVAPGHPFLFRSRLARVAVSGEGEPVFPRILRALRRGTCTDFANVAWRDGRAYRWGRQLPPQPALGDLLPRANDPMLRPDAAGTAYLETTRGCPARCAFCRYGQERRRMTHLSVADVMARIRVLRRRGAREIRLIDPTFNAHPGFRRLLRELARVNADGRLQFFAELRADTLTAEDARLLADANVCHVEVGVQSGDVAVLRAAARPGRPERTLEGIAFLADAGIRTTLDVMCGLPEQTAEDPMRTIERLDTVRGANVQLLHTLLIPGSPLRRSRVRLGLTAQRRPPYRVTATSAMTAEDIVAVDEFAARYLERRFDAPARRFVGWRLPDLFPEKVYVDLGVNRRPDSVAGQESRRAAMFREADLFRMRDRICKTIRKSILEEPDLLWQFVLCPAWEEPLDLVDAMIETIGVCPEHFLDRLHVRRPGEHRVARRVFILLRKGRRYDPSWRAAAEDLLSRAFY